MPVSHPLSLHFSRRCFLALLLSLSAASLRAQDLAASIDAALAGLYKPRDPGATVIVVKDGVTVFRKAYGLASVEKDRKMRPENSLRLGSITKPFTAAAILLLADDEKLALTDTIGRYLPDYPPEAGKSITIQQLLTHISGVPEYSAKPELKPASKRNLSVAQVIDAFKNDPPRFDPGTRFAYSNSGYFLLGAIIEKVSGMSYASFLRQRIFLPLNMRSTGYEGEEGGDILPATGYTLRDREFARAPEISMSLAYSAGALVSTVDDLARFDAAISAGTLLKPGTWQQAHTSARLPDGRQTGYGYGWIVSNFQGTPSISHGGGIDGFFAYVLRLPEHKVFVAVLSNADAGIVAAHVPAFKAAAIAMGKPLPP